MSVSWKKILYRAALLLARTRVGRSLFRMVFSSVNFELPLPRLRESNHATAYKHPDPSYPFHILIVPKQSCESITALAETGSTLLIDVIGIVKSLVEEFELDAVGYRLIVNGGKYQEIPQLHFHLIAEKLP
ncbi:MAG TPA: HIT domain-containing protein [Anaerolineales bacterium]|nr:HIT domain-containing protein [Anaerolineales bacterium]